ncbi:hypothetical protein B5P45_03010 [Phyllobacterium zundukense]|uniref:DUF982 domain-containing protein n=2 Tax=Phyllobacterium zundukense TaxID=1867719 RepID=A0A2N9W4W5_9HYPH|nr:hypothetical protein B5P45_03010 [Phyllobacterium zundukense]
MRNRPFPYVTIMTERVGRMHNVSSVEEAAEWLVMYWPRKHGEKLEAARRACLDCLEGTVTCTAARDAFIDAAKEADIYIRQQKV